MSRKVLSFERQATSGFITTIIFATRRRELYFPLGNLINLSQVLAGADLGFRELAGSDYPQGGSGRFGGSLANATVGAGRNKWPIGIRPARHYLLWPIRSHQSWPTTGDVEEEDDESDTRADDENIVGRRTLADQIGRAGWMLRVH